MAESGVILPADSTGKALRSETVTTAFATGTGGVVHQQVVTLADAAGNLLGTTAAGLPVSLVSSGALTPVAGAITAVAANTPGTAVTASTTGQVVANTALAGNATFHVVTSAFVGTLTFEGSVDAGLNYSPIMAIREDGTGSETSAAISTAAAFIRQYTVALPGLAYFRVRASAFTSGSVAVIIAPGPTLVEPNPSLAASTASIGTVQPPAITKGTQGAVGFSTQDLKDAGRTLFYANGSVTPTAGTEALLSLTPYRTTTAGGAATAGLSVTAGKTLRLSTMQLTVRQAGTAAIGGITAKLRIGTGTLTVTTPFVATASASIPTATANVPASAWVNFPDGLELSGSTSFAVSVLGTAHPCDVVVTGFEY